jgi:hypothetical protein
MQFAPTHINTPNSPKIKRQPTIETPKKELGEKKKRAFAFLLFFAFVSICYCYKGTYRQGNLRQTWNLLGRPDTKPNFARLG